jgi:hypothetical protein
MMHRTASLAAKPLVLSMPVMIGLAIAARPHVYAQPPSTNPPIPSAQTAPEPRAGQAQQAEQLKTGQSSQQHVQLIFSPWARYCATGPKEQSFRN